MIKTIGDFFWIGGLAEDVFGEANIGQIQKRDKTNSVLLKMQLKEYIKWHEVNAKFYEGYFADKRALVRKRYYKLLYTAMGAGFAGIVINPNFTAKRSFYLRKFNILFFAAIAFQWGRKK